jgi:hypothetical protein
MDLVERVAMELNQIEAEDIANVCGNKYNLTVEETWRRSGIIIKDGYREIAIRLVRVIQKEKINAF